MGKAEVVCPSRAESSLLSNRLKMSQCKTKARLACLKPIIHVGVSSLSSGFLSYNATHCVCSSTGPHHVAVWEWGPTQENEDTLALTTAVRNKLSFVSDPEILSLYQDPQNCGKLSQLEGEQYLGSCTAVHSNGASSCTAISVDLEIVYWKHKCSTGSCLNVLNVIS